MILAPGEATGVVERRPAASQGSLGALLTDAGVTDVEWIAPRVAAPGAHMERITVAEAGAGYQAARNALGMRANGGAIDWTPAPPVDPVRVDHVDGALDATAARLTDLVELYGTPGHEWSVRRYLLENLPDWARERAVVDDIGNVWVEVGPERDTTVFVAHTDEVGYDVESIAPDGVVSLRRRGGAVSSAWEGQTALLHFDPEGAPSIASNDGTDTAPHWKTRSLAAEASAPLRGIFLTRDEALRKDPPPEQAWFGLDRSELEARGVRPGMSVTSFKATRFVARALDDRAGTLALLSAVRRLDPDDFQTKVIFAWSVAEEGGLVGAGAMARRFGRSTVRIYSVDTFVSSDTPLESPHFALAPLGAGPVLRATENSGVSPDRERARVRRAASEAGIPLQTGLTQGGTDGTRFTFYGAPNQGLSWPGRYSHSPGEVLDLRDLIQLSALIEAVALADSR